MPSKDVSAYSDPVVANFLLRHLFLCGVLYDPATGDIVYIPPGTHVYVEVQQMFSLLKFFSETCLEILRQKIHFYVGFVQKETDRVSNM